MDGSLAILLFSGSHFYISQDTLLLTWRKTIIDLRRNWHLLFHINQAHKRWGSGTVDWMLSGLHCHPSSLLLPPCQSHSLKSVFPVSLSVSQLTFANSCCYTENNILKRILTWKFLRKYLHHIFPLPSLSPNTPNPSVPSEWLAPFTKTTHFQWEKGYSSPQ